MGGGKWGLGNKSEVRSVGGRIEGRGGMCVCVCVKEIYSARIQDLTSLTYAP